MTNIVYCIEMGDALKIGFTTSLAKRLSALQTASPHQIKVIGAVRGGLDFERELHDRFCSFRIRGEWFSKSDEILSFFANHACDIKVPRLRAEKDRSASSRLADAIGRDVLKDRFGVSSQLVWHHADKNGRFPAAWYDGCCELAGEELPRDLFNWKPLVAAEAPPIPTTEAQA